MANGSYFIPLPRPLWDRFVFYSLSVDCKWSSPLSLTGLPRLLHQIWKYLSNNQFTRIFVWGLLLFLYLRDLTFSKFSLSQNFLASGLCPTALGMIFVNCPANGYFGFWSYTLDPGLTRITRMQWSNNRFTILWNFLLHSSKYVLIVLMISNVWISWGLCPCILKNNEFTTEV